MSELIDRRATKELFCKRCDVVAGIREQICKDSGCWIIKQINEMPTIDAVPVVRCGECINGKPLDNGDVIKCMMIGHNNPPYSYCWWGERREG